jgi:hypothetical protein
MPLGIDDHALLNPILERLKQGGKWPLRLGMNRQPKFRGIQSPGNEGSIF